MALEPCNVCGSLNSSEAEICQSCGNPTKGNKRSLIFRVAAIAIAVAFTLPSLIASFSWFRLQLKPRRQSLPQPKVTFSIKNLE